MGQTDDTTAAPTKPPANLPFYVDHDPPKPAAQEEPDVVRSTLASYIRTSRLAVSGTVESVTSSVNRLNNSVTTKYNTAKAHTYGVVDFLQSEPELWQRCGIVAIAGVTGIISGYRRSGLVKTRNMLLLGGVAGAICWPKQTVEAFSHSYDYVKEPVVDWWTEHSPNSLHRPMTTAKRPPADFYTNKPMVQQDHGQSNAEDKDMYSTRSS